MNPQFFCCCCRSLKQLVDCNLQQGVYKKKKGPIVDVRSVFLIDRASELLITKQSRGEGLTSLSSVVFLTII